MRTFKKFQPAVLLPVVATTLLGGLALADGGDLLVEETLTEEAATSAGAGRIRLGGFLGGNYLSSDNELGNSFHNDQVPESGFLLGLRGSYLLFDSLAPDSSLDPQLSVELEGKYTISSTEGGSGRESISSPILGWRANLVMDLMPDRKLVPFALLGMGGETVMGSNKFMTSPDTDIATYVGGGVRYPVAEQVDFRGDLRLGLMAGREESLAGLAELHFGVTYSFGKGAAETLIIAEPEPQREPEPKRIADADRDGVADDVDACPQLAEIMNGIDDTDGCPEVDSDSDGLLGSKDLCPAAAEDIDGFQDDDGCPEPDNDEDGRPDVIDQCPAKPETLNGFEDEDGCPDEIPEKVARFTGTIKGIEFKTASARILRSSRKTLDAAFKVMTENPTIRIEISGHTDNQGSDKGNRSLSRKRADYVKWYLVDKGIHADRIWTQGLGPDKPVASNDTRAGRQNNRRIEFKLLLGPATVAAPKGVKLVPVSGPGPAPVAPPK